MTENKKQVLFPETDQNNPSRLIEQMIVKPFFSVLNPVIKTIRKQGNPKGFRGLSKLKTRLCINCETKNEMKNTDFIRKQTLALLLLRRAR